MVVGGGGGGVAYLISGMGRDVAGKLLCIFRHNMAVLDLHALFIPALREGRGYRNRGWSCSEQRKTSIHLFIQVGKLHIQDCT